MPIKKPFFKFLKGWWGKNKIFKKKRREAGSGNKGLDGTVLIIAFCAYNGR